MVASSVEKDQRNVLGRLHVYTLLLLLLLPE